MTTGLRTPVAMLVFNRPDTTVRVLETVRAARPRRLLVVADGPRDDRPGEAERCAAVRALFDRLDWECAVEREFASRNLGCKRRVASGLGWVFARAEEAIILEDDCLPEPGFFAFCEELLERYRDDERVLAITGNNFQRGQMRGEASYYFSRHMHVWGWASWRRAWRHYDVALEEWPRLRDRGWLGGYLQDRDAARSWGSIFDRTHAGEIDTWDYQLTFAVWARDGLVATPNVNLVSNIGGGLGATHTRRASRLLGMPTRPTDSPLRHPAEVRRHEAADRFLQEVILAPSPLQRLGNLAARILGR